MGAAEHAPILLHAVTEYAAVAMRARRRERLNGALEAIERVLGALHTDPKCLVVFVPANFTLIGHRLLPSTRRQGVEWMSSPRLRRLQRF
jgi:hypothetical protein